MILSIRDREGNRVDPLLISYTPYFYYPVYQQNMWYSFIKQNPVLRDIILEEEKGYTSTQSFPLVKVYVRYPYNVKEITNLAIPFQKRTGKYFHLHESNIIFTKRFLIDKKLYTGINDKLEPVEIESKHRKIFLDIEVEGEEEWKEESYKYPIIILGLYDEVTKRYYQFYIGEDMEVDKEDKDSTYLLFPCIDEKDLLEKIARIWSKISPDVVVTFSPFDMNYILNRLKILEINYSFLSPIRKVTKGPHFHCLDVLDYALLYRKVVKEQTWHTLEYISKKELGYGKIKLENKIYQTWKMDKKSVLEYNLRDVKLLKDLEQKLHFIRDYIVPIWELTGLSFSDCLSPNKIADILYLRDSNGREVWKSYSYIKASGYKGALVIASPGIYDNILVMDWSELYPCLDQETECLTEEGWKKYNNLKEGENILTFNKEERRLEYQPINKLIIKEYNGIMYHFKGLHYCDMKVTPNHRIIYENKRYRKKELQVSKAKDLVTYVSIPCTGSFNGSNRYNENLVKLSAWIITEGSVPKEMPFNRKLINIYQSFTVNRSNCEEIANILKELGFHFQIYDRKRKGSIERTFRLNSYASRFMWEFLEGKKSIPRKLLNLQIDQLELFFETLLKGDGHSFKDRKYNKILYTVDEELANKYHELAVKLNKRAIIRKFNNEYCIKITNKVDFNIHSSFCSLVKYKGKVWCPSVKNNFFMVRRNGNSFITGNSIMETFHISWDTYTRLMGDIKVDRDLFFSSKEEGQSNRLVRPFREKRREIKNLKRTTDKETRDSLKRRSDAFKSIINACSYGIYGYQSRNGYFGSRLYDPNVAAAITLMERIIFNEVKDYIKEIGYEMVYGDTDSIFVQLKREDYEVESKEILDKIQSHIDKFIEDNYHVPSKLKISIEYILKRIIIITKKRYQGVTLGGEEIVRGIEIVRMESAPITSIVEKAIGDLILNYKEDEIERYTESIKRDIINKKIPLEDIAIRPRCTKDEYKTLTRNYKAVKICEEYTKEKIKKGNRFFLFHIVPKKKLKTKLRLDNEEKEVIFDVNVIGLKRIEDLPIELEIDYPKMIEYTVISPVQKYLNAIKEKSYKQKSISDYR